MSYLQTHFWPGGTEEQYKVSVKMVHPKSGLPEGQRSHTAGPTERGYMISVVWDSKEQSDPFMNNALMNAMPVEGGLAGGAGRRGGPPRHGLTPRRRLGLHDPHLHTTIQELTLKATTMATYLVVLHEVDDVEHWLDSSKREEVFGPQGITARTFRDPNGSNRVGLIVEIPDLAAYEKFMQTEEAAEAMRHDGVRPEAVRVLAEGSAPVTTGG